MKNWQMGGAVVATMMMVGLAGAAAAPHVDKPHVDIKAILASPDRPEADKLRDADRKPAETIAFAGIKAGSKVAELGPGGGYFTRVLTGAVGDTGRVYTMLGRPSPVLTDYATKHANLTLVPITPGEITVPEPVDVVWTTLNYHDFKNAKVGDSDVATRDNAAAFKALKPGGVYLIIDHQAAKGAGTSVTSTLHRIEDVAVIKEVEAAGFKLDGESKILRHPADDHSQPIADSGPGRGKTDQFVLRFRKPR